MQIVITQLRQNAMLPYFDEKDDYKLMFRANSNEASEDEKILMPRSSLELKTGIKLEVENSYYPLVKCANDLNKRGITCELDYIKETNELIIKIYNNSSVAVTINNGDEVAYLIFTQVATAQNTEITFN